MGPQASLPERPSWTGPGSDMARDDRVDDVNGEEIWESDIFGPEAWDDGESSHRTAEEVHAQPSPSPRPGSTQQFSYDGYDSPRELWESDLYGLEAWEAVGVVDVGATADLAIVVESDGRNNGARGGSESDIVPVTTHGSDDGVQRARPAASTHEEVYWPNVEEYLLTGRGSRPVVICSVCQTSELVIEGLQPPNISVEQEECVVLSCGHVVGERCWSQWASFQVGARKIVKCPVCNLSV